MSMGTEKGEVIEARVGVGLGRLASGSSRASAAVLLESSRTRNPRAQSVPDGALSVRSDPKSI